MLSREMLSLSLLTPFDNGGSFWIRKTQRNPSSSADWSKCKVGVSIHLAIVMPAIDIDSVCVCVLGGEVL